MQAVEQRDRMASLMVKGHVCSPSNSTVQVEESYHFLRICQVLSQIPQVHYAILYQRLLDIQESNIGLFLLILYCIASLKMNDV